MAGVDGFEISELTGGLRSPVVIMAFSGWSDTGTVTTDTVRRLIDTHKAKRFLSVDPEDYYVFTDSRPTVRLGEANARELHWPMNEAYAATLSGTNNDLILSLIH